MLDLKKCENENKRNEYWKTFEEIADKNPILYGCLSIIKKIPKKHRCELCFLFTLLSEKIIPKLNKKLSLKEIESVTSVLWGNMERKGNCNCNAVQDKVNKLNEITR